MAEKVVEEIVANGGRTMAYKCDVSNEEEVKGDVRRRDQ